MASGLLALLVLVVAAHQFLTSRDGVLSAWKGGGFGMYTSPHGIDARVTFLIVDGHPLRLAPADPVFAAWAESGDRRSAEYLARLVNLAERMRTYPKAGQADQLMALAVRVVWEGDLFGTWRDPGQQPSSALEVVVIEVARRTSVGAIETRVVFRHAGE
jgi:hypothetical protein